MCRSGPVGVRLRRRFGECCCEAVGKKISLCCVLNRQRKEQGGLGFVACPQWGGAHAPCCPGSPSQCAGSCVGYKPAHSRGRDWIHSDRRVVAVARPRRDARCRSGRSCAHRGSDMRRGPRLLCCGGVRDLREELGRQAARAYARGRSRRAALDGGVLSVGAVASPDDAAGWGCYERSCWGTVPTRSSPSRDGWQHTRGTLGFPREELGSRARLRFRCA